MANSAYSSKTNLEELSPEELDSYAWWAICNWPKYTKANMCYEDLDYAILTRFFLWDKVGRALRKAYYPAEFAFENSLPRRTVKKMLPSHPHNSTVL